ncbi:unnamed protein product [Rhizoctonia solani]|uniref:BTB domain-containing protein n=1 Tax=Rhizoctonia solani TaxID=456999 RepID=A0A8H2XEK5_9AGAM|nr:unnamed protein product [Rhizoctonia solani]
MAKKKSTTLASRGASAMFIERAAEVKSDDEVSGTESSELVERHPEFFFDNTLVAIQVGKTLFNVHKYQLSKSEVFSDRFKKPKPEGNEPEEGSSPEYPIKLKGVSASDFAALLRVLYASHFSSNQPAPEAPLIIPAFRLANMFKFAELRAFLLPLAEKNLVDVDNIVFAREFDIKEWLAPAHIRLCQRQEHLSGEEARKLGVESVLVISRMREQHRSQRRTSSLAVNNYYCYGCVGLTFAGDGYTCRGCRTNTYGSGYLRYDGPGKITQNDTTTINDTAIETEMEKWVEDGCTVKD